jgi:hypothetical protein
MPQDPNHFRLAYTLFVCLLIGFSTMGQTECMDFWASVIDILDEGSGEGSDEGNGEGTGEGNEEGLGEGADPGSGEADAWDFQFIDTELGLVAEVPVVFDGLRMHILESCPGGVVNDLNFAYTITNTTHFEVGNFFSPTAWFVQFGNCWGENNISTRFEASLTLTEPLSLVGNYQIFRTAGNISSSWMNDSTGLIYATPSP